MRMRAHGSAGMCYVTNKDLRHACNRLRAISTTADHHTKLSFSLPGICFNTHGHGARPSAIDSGRFALLFPHPTPLMLNGLLLKESSSERMSTID